MANVLKVHATTHIDSEVSHELLPIALFCGIGLMLSLAVLIADQFISGDWF